MFRKNSYALVVCVILALCFSCQSSSENERSKTDLVDTRIGTQSWEKQVMVSDAESPSGFVMPIVSAPFAAINWTPQTCKMHDAHIKVGVAYWWQDQKLQGFRGTRYPNGAVMMDWGCISTLPTVGKLEPDAEQRASSYRHSTEIAQPHYYKVILDDYNIKAELTAGKHTGFFNYTFSTSDTANIIIDGVYQSETFCILPQKQQLRGISSYGRSGIKSFFVAQFDTPFIDYGLFLDKGKLIDKTWVPEGFKQQFFNNIELKGAPTVANKCNSIDYVWPAAPHKKIKADGFSARWTGVFIPRISGKHTFFLTSDDGARLFINNKLIINGWEYRGTTTDEATIQLEKGRKYQLRYEYFEGGGAATAKLACQDPISSQKKWTKEQGEHKGLAAFARFKTKEGQTIKVKIATSLIGYEQAERNLKFDFPNWDFTVTVKEQQKVWNNALSKICVQGDKDLQKIFYTALNRCYLLPRDLKEENRYFSPFDQKIHEGEMYTDLSLWDTFRAEHPLLVLLAPKRSGEIIQGLLNAYDEGGWMPKWPNPSYANVMMGTHADAVIADAYQKGIDNFDLSKALEAMLKNASQKGDRGFAGRVGIEDYNRLGYVPSDKYSESVARTLEFAYDDYCIAQMAKKMGKKAIFKRFMQRSKRYQKVFNTTTRMIRGKDSKGNWLPQYDTSISVWAKNKDPKMTEAYYRNHTLLAPHDIEGLAQLMGGNDALKAFLDDFFARDFYYVGDEFSMHAPYMYNFIGAPWRTQKVVRSILSDYFTSSEGGLPGNDDCGQLSAWYVFGAIGLYPVCPGNPIYQIGSPVFETSTITVGKDKTFTIVAHNNNPQNVYIQSATLNGKPYQKSWIAHSTLVEGGTLVLEMSDKPNKEWGLDK